MGRTVDQWSGIAGQQAASQLGAIRAGLASGSMLRGQTERDTRGEGEPPRWGAILLPGQVDAVTPHSGVGRPRSRGRSSGGGGRGLGLGGTGGRDTGGAGQVVVARRGRTGHHPGESASPGLDAAPRHAAWTGRPRTVGPLTGW